MKKKHDEIDFDGLAIFGGLATFAADITASRTLTADDLGKVLPVNSGSGVTLTIPASLRRGFNCLVYQKGAGAVTFAAGTGVTARSTEVATNLQYGTASLLVLETNEFIIKGDVA